MATMGFPNGRVNLARLVMVLLNNLPIRGNPITRKGKAFTDWCILQRDLVKQLWAGLAGKLCQRFSPS